MHTTTRGNWNEPTKTVQNPNKHELVFLISNFRRGLNVLCFLLGNSPPSEFYMPTFRNTLFHLHRQVGMKMGQSVPKRRHINFRRLGIAQKKACSINWFLYLISPLNAQSNPICHLLALLGTHHIFHVSGLRVKLYNMQTWSVMCVWTPHVLNLRCSWR